MIILLKRHRVAEGLMRRPSLMCNFDIGKYIHFAGNVYDEHTL